MTLYHQKPRVEDETKTVGTSGDFTTIQDAIDWFKTRTISGSCVIDVDAGAYDEAVVFEDIYMAKDEALTLRGDTRVLAGISYIDGANANRNGLTNGGSGAVTLANAGNVITVTCATTNPAFDTDGWGSGDAVLVYDNTGTTTEYTVSSTLNNTITLTVAAPAVGNDGTAICLLPNRRIERSTAGPCVDVLDSIQGVRIQGFYLHTSTGADCHGVRGNDVSLTYLDGVAVNAQDQGVRLVNALIRMSDGSAVSFWECNRAVFLSSFSSAAASYAFVVAGVNGIYGALHSFINANQATVANCSGSGFRSAWNTTIYAPTATARQCGTGYYALDGSYIYATNTNANNNGNGTNYNPAVSDTFGNSNSFITWS